MTDIIINTNDSQLADDLKSVNIEGLTVRPRFMFRDSGDIQPVIDNVWQFAVNHTGDIALGLFISWLYDRLKRNPKKKTVINGQEISGEHIQIKYIRQVITNKFIVTNGDDSGSEQNKKRRLFMKVKIFTNQGNAPKLEKEINEWLDVQVSIKIHHIKQSYAFDSKGDQFYTIVSIWYV